MNHEKRLRTSFLTYYIRSLGERTRHEKSGTKFGFDWVIYNMELAANWIPYRLPFLRSGAGETSKTKTEPEFGIDLAFLSTDRKTLRIFVLKDEVLNNRNWASHDFDTDIRNASAPDLSGSDLREVTEVEVILAYNKDEDHAGVELFNRRVGAQGNSIGGMVTLRFDRWNLTTIVEKVEGVLLSPMLLPQKFFSQFSYICSQFADFRHGSDEWWQQLVPNWQNFLKELLSENSDERCVRLLPVALIVLLENGRENPTVETAWIDLLEWGLLAAWEVSRKTNKDRIKQAVAEMWVSLYLVELERYYQTHANDLFVPFSLDHLRSGSFVDTVAAGILAHWHSGRIGILGIGYHELLPRKSEQEAQARFERLNEVANWQTGFLNANPSAMRPILDIHHIQLFLIWGVFRQVGRARDLHQWLLMLANRLSVRRVGSGEIPFIEGGNSIELVFEYVASQEKPPEFCDTSSVFLMCLMELVCALPEAERDPLLEMIHRRMVLGNDDFGTQMEGCEPIDLMMWFPPIDWHERVLSMSLSDEGDCATVTLGKLDEHEPSTGHEIVEAIAGFVAQSRKKRDFEYPKGLPLSVLVLACLKYGTPLPPELWRRSIFPGSPKENAELQVERDD